MNFALYIVNIIKFSPNSTVLCRSLSRFRFSNLDRRLRLRSRLGNYSSPRQIYVQSGRKFPRISGWANEWRCSHHAVRVQPIALHVKEGRQAGHAWHTAPHTHGRPSSTPKLLTWHVHVSTCQFFHLRSCTWRRKIHTCQRTYYSGCHCHE
jgi:hypothetical protein